MKNFEKFFSISNYEIKIINNFVFVENANRDNNFGIMSKEDNLFFSLSYLFIFKNIINFIAMIMCYLKCVTIR